MNLNVLGKSPFTYFMLDGLFNRLEMNELLNKFPEDLEDYISDSYSKFRIENATLKMWRLKKTPCWKKAFDKFSVENLIDLAISLKINGSDNYVPVSLNPIRNFINKNVLKKTLLISSYEFSILVDGASLVPHTDSRNKVLTLMLYVATESQEGRKNLGTTFHGFPEDVVGKYENFENKHYTRDLYPEFYDEHIELYNVPYRSDQVHGFVKGSQSWHSMYPVKLAENEYRRSVNVNLYYYNRSSFSYLYETLKFVVKDKISR